MPTLLVTGGAGYVGSHCCKRFASEGWKVVVFDNLSRGWRDMVRYGELLEGDLLDQGAIGAAMERVKPDVVAHFAAVAYVGESVTNPGLYYRNNAVGTLNLVEAMRDAGIDKLIFSSTCATYGVPSQIPIDEGHRQQPINPYGWSKLFAERMLADFATAHPLRYIVLRYFNAAGADADGEIGERHVPEPHAIPLAIQAGLDPAHAFTIFGNDFDTRDGTAIRDYVHVSDLADAHARAVRHLLNGGANDVFNLGTGTGVSVAEIIAAVERVAGRPIRRHKGPRRAGDPPVLVASSEKARSVLDWTPTHSAIDSIVESAWAWHAAEQQKTRRD